MFVHGVHVARVRPEAVVNRAEGYRAPVCGWWLGWQQREENDWLVEIRTLLFLNFDSFF